MQQDDLYIFESPALGMLKIGHSRNPKKRLASGSAFCPDPDGRLLVVISGAGKHENAVHKAFSKHHSHKEWFFDAPEIREWIRRGCSLDELPRQLRLSKRMSYSISRRHNPEHIAGLVAAIEDSRK